MVNKVFLQWFSDKSPTGGSLKMSPIGYDQRILEKAFKGVFYPLPDAFVRFSLEPGDSYSVDKTS